MRNALLAVVAVVAAVVAGWILDDKLLGGDIARNTSIAGVDVGRLNIDEAAELLTDGRLTDRPIELRHDTNTLTITAAELGVMVDAELALADAAEQPDLIAQPIRWIGSLFRNRSFDVRYTVDVDVLGEVVVLGRVDHLLRVEARVVAGLEVLLVSALALVTPLPVLLLAVPAAVTREVALGAELVGLVRERALAAHVALHAEGLRSG